jgi:hypothetical protein
LEGAFARGAGWTEGEKLTNRFFSDKGIFFPRPAFRLVARVRELNIADAIRERGTFDVFWIDSLMHPIEYWAWVCVILSLFFIVFSFQDKTLMLSCENLIIRQ